MGGLPPKPPIGGRVASQGIFWRRDSPKKMPPKPPAKCLSINPLGFGKTHFVGVLAVISNNNNKKID